LVEKHQRKSKLIKKGWAFKTK